MTLNYVTLNEFKKMSSVGDLDVDKDATWALESAEELIEDYCGRRFWKDASDTTRYYGGADLVSNGTLIVDDLATLTSLATDDDVDGTFETTWTSSDYLLYPYNAATDDRAYTHIVVPSYGQQVFPSADRSIRVVGAFGWPTVPSRVKEAVVLQATQLLKRARSAPFGIETVGVDGAPVRLRAKIDPQVEVMLATLRRYKAA